MHIGCRWAGENLCKEADTSGLQCVCYHHADVDYITILLECFDISKNLLLGLIVERPVLEIISSVVLRDLPDNFARISGSKHRRSHRIAARK